MWILNKWETWSQSLKASTQMGPAQSIIQVKLNKLLLFFLEFIAASLDKNFYLKQEKLF